MVDEDQIVLGKSLISQLAQICRDLPDESIPSLLEEGAIDDLLNGIFDPTRVTEFPTIAEFLLANKNRSAYIAAIRLAITMTCSFEGKAKDGKIGYASPSDKQWFDDGVMLLEGPKRFEGLVGLYRNGRMSYAVAARTVQEGENVGPEAFHFLDMEVFKDDYKDSALPKKHELDKPLETLKGLLEVVDSNESKYQVLLQENPWVLGLAYKRIVRHTNLDNRNIPDFTAVKVGSEFRDIFEIKPPSMKCFRSDGEFTMDFNATWNQAERYLNFVREDVDYLRRKGLFFNNPKCTIICGYNLSDEECRKLHIKEKMNPAIHVMTYNDMMVFIESTVRFVRRFGGALTHDDDVTPSVQGLTPPNY